MVHSNKKCVICIFPSGGQLGLWVGISAITMCEILGMITNLIQHLVCKTQHDSAHTLEDKYEHERIKTSELKEETNLST